MRRQAMRARRRFPVNATKFDPLCLLGNLVTNIVIALPIRVFIQDYCKLDFSGINWVLKQIFGPVEGRNCAREQTSRYEPMF